jgi:acetyl-CoA C-acetyltransferase
MKELITMEQAVIVSAARTPMGRFLGGLSTTPAPRLGSIVVGEVLERAGLDRERVDEVLMGCVLQAGLGQNPARQAAIHAGLPPEVAAMTVNKVCGSGMKSVMLAAQAIRVGDEVAVVAGGMENMSLAPYLLRKGRTGYRLGDGKVVDSMVADGLWDCYEDFHMGNTAELVVQKYKVSREDQDAFAASSHRKAVAAIEQGKFKDEIVEVTVPQRKGDPLVVDTDEGPRGDSSEEKLARLKPVFQKDGTVTAGNASTINDGAAALLVMSEKAAGELGLRPLARIVNYAVGGVEPKWVMMAPVPAVKKLLEKTGTSIGDYDLVELNEAFSAQAVAVTRELEMDPERVNVHGGAVALGHPIGCSGARILVTLLHALKDRGKKRGLAALCLGGGNATAMAVEML